MIIQYIRKVTLPARRFEPLILSSSDQLPQDIMLVGAFQGLMDVEKISKVFDEGLCLFPHLTGSFCEHTKRIIQESRGIELELLSCEQELNVKLLEQMPIETLKSCFLPDEESWDVRAALFGARIVHFPYSKKSVLGIRISHRAVDGTGLALFLRSCMCSRVGHKQLKLYHERSVLQIAQNMKAPKVPHGYREKARLEEDQDEVVVRKRENTSIFTISIKKVMQHWGSSSLIDARLCLAAWLSSQCAIADPVLSELAVWCDVRGLQKIPQTYTGNCGCFIHEPLSSSVEEMTECWRKFIKRDGFKRVSEVFSQLQTLEAAGKDLVWKDEKHVLQVNIVPHSVASVDFGYGKALFGMILARNSSGIRISITPDETKFLLEVELSQTVRKYLLKTLIEEGFSLELWGQGVVN